MSPHRSIPGTLVRTEADIISGRTPGAFAYVSAVSGFGIPQPGTRPDAIYFVCPCGCGGIGNVSLLPGGWRWDGNIERPTLNPSIYFERGRPGEWHGYLRAGRWEGC